MIDRFNVVELSTKTGYKKPLNSTLNGSTLYPIDDNLSPNITPKNAQGALEICAKVAFFIKIDNKIIKKHNKI